MVDFADLDGLGCHVDAYMFNHPQSTFAVHLNIFIKIIKLGYKYRKDNKIEILHRVIFKYNMPNALVIMRVVS